MPGLYVDGEEALRHGDNTWVMRFRGADNEIAGIALFLMGNTTGALSRFGRMSKPSSRSILFTNLCRWAEDGSTESANTVSRCLLEHHQTSEILALSKVVRTCPLRALFLGGPVQRIGLLAKDFVGVDSAIGTIDPLTGGTSVSWANGDAETAADGNFDIVFIDPSHWMAADLSRFGGVKVAFIGDLEWHFHHEPTRYADIDLLLSLGTQGSIEAQRRFQRPAVVGPIAVHLGFVSVDPSFLSKDSSSVWTGLSRPIDVVSTGHQKHVAGLYYDKPVFNRAMIGIDERWSVSMANKMLPDSEYVALMRRAKYVASSHRYGLGQPWRVFEALAVGAMVIVDSGSGVADRFSRPYSAVHHLRSGFLRRDFEYHLENYASHTDRFLDTADDFFEELQSIFPDSRGGVAKTLRTLLVGAFLARHGYPDSGLRRWTRSPAGEALAADLESGQFRIPVHKSPAVQSIHASPAAKAWLKARKHGPGHTFVESREEMANAHIRHAIEDLSTAALLEQSFAFRAQFPDHGLPPILEAAAFRLNGQLMKADQCFDQFLDRLDSWVLASEDARPEWRLGIFPVCDLIDAAMRDSLSPLWPHEGRTDEHRLTDQVSNLRQMFAVAALSMEADSALRRSDFGLAATKSGEALARHPLSGPAGGVHLQALRRRLGQVEQAERQFLSAFDRVAGQNQELFHLFCWSALCASIQIESEEAISTRALALALSWVRSGRPTGAAMVPPWAKNDAELALTHPIVLGILTNRGFALATKDD